MRCLVIADRWLEEYYVAGQNVLHVKDVRFVRLVPITSRQKEQQAKKIFEGNPARAAQ